MEANESREKEWVLKSLSRLVDDLSAGLLTEASYKDRLGEMEALVDEVRCKFHDYFDSLGIQALDEPPDLLIGADEEARNSLDTIRHLFSRAFLNMRYLTSGAGGHYLEEALACAGQAMDEVARLDELSERAYALIRGRSL